MNTTDRLYGLLDGPGCLAMTSRSHRDTIRDAAEEIERQAAELEKLQGFVAEILACRIDGPPYKGWNITKLNKTIADAAASPIDTGKEGEK